MADGDSQFEQLSFNTLITPVVDVNVPLAQLSVGVLWSEDVPLLLQMTGIGLVSAMTILSAIGDITRFPTPKQLVGYAGLGAGVHRSGQTARSGPITKSGRGELRTTLIQVAWAATRYSPYWRDCFNRLAPRKGSHKAITIIARKILVVIWHLLTDRWIMCVRSKTPIRHSSDVDAPDGHLQLPETLTRRWRRFPSNYKNNADM